ncbi:MAG: histidine phosphatase family protein [Glaciihabitans sp.]|nr:histidine phosphatase family protein [Glaciihabitans sp.]
MVVNELWLVRHGESMANRAATAAEQHGLSTIDVDARDADVELSPTGRQQAAALGRWLAENAADGAPASVWSSPYLRARQTAQLALGEAQLDLPVLVDERLRDRELGILDLLTSHGVEEKYPDEAARRRWLGKFYYRPPGGESWADVVLRVRSYLRDVDTADASGTVLIAAHDAVVMLFLYVCLGLTEEEILTFARTNTVSNASVTRLTRTGARGVWTLQVFAHDDHLENLGVPVTEHPGNDDVHPH